MSVGDCEEKLIDTKVFATLFSKSVQVWAEPTIESVEFGVWNVELIIKQETERSDNKKKTAK